MIFIRSGRQCGKTTVNKYLAELFGEKMITPSNYSDFLKQLYGNQQELIVGTAVEYYFTSTPKRITRKMQRNRIRLARVKNYKGLFFSDDLWGNPFTVPLCFKGK